MSPVKHLSPVKATEQTVHMEEETTARGLKHQSKIGTQKQQYAFESEIENISTNPKNSNSNSRWESEIKN